MAKNGSDLYNFYRTMKSGKKLLLFFTDFELLVFHNNIVKLSEILKKWDLLKTCIQTTYRIDVCIICNRFYYGKNGFSLKKTPKKPPKKTRKQYIE